MESSVVRALYGLALPWVVGSLLSFNPITTIVGCLLVYESNKVEVVREGIVLQPGLFVSAARDGTTSAETICTVRLQPRRRGGLFNYVSKARIVRPSAFGQPGTPMYCTPRGERSLATMSLISLLTEDQCIGVSGFFNS